MPTKAITLRALGLNPRALGTNPRSRQGQAWAPRRRPGPAFFYETDLWRRLRYQALKRCGGCCQCCGARGARGHPLHVDHTKPRAKFPELELELSNLQVLCEDCNLGKGAWDRTDWRGR